MPRENDLSETGKQGIAYVLVGGGTALLELGLFQLLFELMKLPLAVSNVSATVVATAVNFLLNRNVTFKSTSNPVRSLVLYIMLFGANMAISTLMIGVLVGLGLPSAAAKLLMQACVVVWNFVLYRKLIFI
jgi:putative flippase GtrA